MLEPLSHRERGRGEDPSISERIPRPNPHPPLRGTFSRWEKEEIEE